MLRFKHFGEGIGRGLNTTFKHLFRRWITVQYPEQKLNMSRRLRGTDIIWVKENCIACKACERACPVQCIKMDVSRDEDRKLKVDYIGIDFGLCIFCGLCIESCPPGNAIYLSRSYERVTYRCTTIQNERSITSSDKRCQELYIENDNLTEVQAKQKSAYFRPELHNKLPKQTLLLEQNSYSQNTNKKEQWQ